MTEKASRRAAAGPTIPKGAKPWVIDRLKPDPRNARTHSPSQITRIAASIATYGFNNPVLAAADGTVIAGHARLEAARTLKLELVPVVVLEHLSERERRAYMLADNRLAELAEWDREVLGAELAELAREGVDVDTLGWSEEDMRAVLAEEPPAIADPDEIPEAPAEPTTRSGDLWLLGEHRLLCGDATAPASWKRLCDGDPDKAQVVFTDPPYGVAYEDTRGNRVRNDHKKGDPLVALLSGAFGAAGRYVRDDAAWYVWHASSARAEFDRALVAAGLVELQYLIWAKPSASLGRAHFQWAHEPCYYASREGVQPAWHGGRDQATVWRFGISRVESSAAVLGTGLTVTAEGGGSLFVTPNIPKHRKLRQVRIADGRPAQLRVDAPESTLWEVGRDHAPEHPTQKPVELAVRALRNSSSVGQVVLDPFGGSGSTLLGAEELGRAARLTELEPRWVDLILERWAKATGREPRLAGKKTRTLAAVREERGTRAAR